MKLGINHNVSEASYHAFPAVSKSTLWSFAKNPSKWVKTKDIARKPTDSMVWGSLVDCLLLQPAELDKSFAVSPYPSFRSKEAQAWRDAQTLPIIDDKMISNATNAADLIRNHHFAGEFLAGSKAQVSILLEGKEAQTGERFKSKCRLDFVPDIGGPRSEWLGDLKTTNDLSKLEWTIRDFGYHVQAAWYLDHYNAATGEGRTRWAFIFQESEAPYEIAVVELSEEAIEKGREWYNAALAKWCHSHASGHFPNPWDDEIKIVGGRV